MKYSRPATRRVIPVLLFCTVVFGCSGTTHSSAEITLFEISLGRHSGKAPKNKTEKTDAARGYLPKTLGDLNLAKVIKNRDAAVIIDKMHGKRLDDCKNFIAYYGSRDSKNILYVSVYDTAEQAKTNLKKMAMKMAGGSSVFTPLTHGKMGEKVHFETQGMGLKHYFYRTGRILIWWQVEPDKAATTLDDLRGFDFSFLQQQ